MQLTLLRGILIFVGIISFLIFPKTISQATELELPTQYDWRDHGYDFPVLDQGECNIGFVFAAIDAIQSAIWLKDSKKVDFSENHAKECNWHALNYSPVAYTCWDENIMMIRNLFTQQGLVLDACDPYHDNDTSCNQSCSYQYRITEWQQFSPTYSIEPSNSIKQHLMEYGPLYTQMDPKISGFSAYNGNDVLYDNSSFDPNKYTHGVLIVGWDDGLKHSDGAGAWIVKNSYGTEWGDAGYFYIAYNSAGIGSSLSTATGWEKPSSFNRLHFYDEGGYTQAIMTDQNNFFSGTSMSLFNLEANEVLQSVELWTTDTATVNIEIYEQFNGTEPVNLVYHVNDLAIPYGGYHQVNINQNQEWGEEMEVAVVVNVQNQSNFFPVAVDHHGPLSSDKTWFRNELGIWQSFSANPDLNFEGTIRLRTLLIPEELNHKIFLPIVSTK